MLSKLLGGSGSGRTRGKDGCGGIGCLALIAYFLYRYLGGEAAPADF